MFIEPDRLQTVKFKLAFLQYSSPASASVADEANREDRLTPR